MNKDVIILDILEAHIKNEKFLSPINQKILLEYIEDLQKKAELGETYKKLYGEIKKQKDELETSYDILQNNNITLAKQKEEAYKIADDYYNENYKLKKQKDDVVEFVIKLYQKEYNKTSDWWLQEELCDNFDDMNIFTNFELERRLGERDE